MNVWTLVMYLYSFPLFFSKNRPIGVFNMAARKTKLPNVAMSKMANIMMPNICVGVKVLNANAAKPRPAINVVWVIAVALREYAYFVASARLMSWSIPCRNHVKK